MPNGETIKTFLVSLKSLVGNVSSLKPAKLRFVTGNQSADLDSVVCSIAHAFYYYKYEHDKNGTLFPLIPLINISKKDLKLRKDIEFVLKGQSISEDNLFFIEDLNTLARSVEDVEFVLVDHNAPQGAVSSFIEQNSSRSKIVGIIDHHEDEGLYLNSEPRIIQKCGSCSTLVFDYWFGRVKDLFSFGKQDIEFISSPLLSDTSNLTHRIEKPDLEVGELYKQILGQTYNFQARFEEIKEEKNNLNGLSFSDLLRKDYKQFHWTSPTHGSRIIGISSIVVPFDWLKANKSSDILSDAVAHGADNELDMVIIMTSFVDSNGQFCREIGFLNIDKKLQNFDEELIGQLKDQLQFEHLEDIGELKVFKQLNIAASRKQVAPAIKKIIESL